MAGWHRQCLHRAGRAGRLGVFTALLALAFGQEAPAIRPVWPPKLPPLLTRTAEGWAVPQPGWRPQLPRDHGSHPEFALEWWYLTGHLWATDGRRFGFQATFFRRGLSLPREGQSGPFGRDQVYLAHMAVTDVTGQRFLHQERLNRAGWDAGASTDTLAVHNGNWRLDWVPDTPKPTLRLQGGVRADASFVLTLTADKPAVSFGADGVSRKGAAPTAASHYLTFTRLTANGQLQVGEETLAVKGQAWMDHEISSSQLDPQHRGWDWASVQLADGRELMVYQMRLKDGGVDPCSTLAWVDREGRLTQVGPAEFSLTPRRWWRSPRHGAAYPVALTLRAPDPSGGPAMVLHLDPLLDAQEHPGELSKIPYWEGACVVRDEAGRELGAAYVELTGYAGDLGGRF